MKHIACFHLYNDYSGSPKVLDMALRGLLAKGYRIDLHTSRGGVLDTLPTGPALYRHSYSYRFSPSGLRTMAAYARVQLLTALQAFRYIGHRDTTFYINTLLPIGPALVGRLTGHRVVYHYHENAVAHGGIYSLLARAMELIANEIICVSAHQASGLKRKRGVRVVPNAVAPDFAARVHPDPESAWQRRRVLMLSSLKVYKGTAEFITLARQLPELAFTLVINDTQEAIDAWIAAGGAGNEPLPPNLTILPRQSDVAPLYDSASVVLNLSDPNLFVETFGLTALEAMTAGLPVIVPPVGGIAEMVTDGVEGYRRQSPAQLDEIAELLRHIHSDRDLYLHLAEGALRRAGRYSAEAMTTAIEQSL